MLLIGFEREASVDKKDTLVVVDSNLDLVGLKTNPNLKEGSSILEAIFITCLSDLRYYSTVQLSHPPSVHRRHRRLSCDILSKRVHYKMLMLLMLLSKLCAQFKQVVSLI